MNYSMFRRIIFSLIWITLCFANSSAAESANYTAAPPFVATEVGDPNVVIALDISGSMKAVAYADVGAGNWRSGLHNDFSPNNKYFGYFDSNSQYSYDPSPDKQFFYRDTSGVWNGQYLNWLTMRRMDVVRKVLVGGKVKDREGKLINGTRWYIVEGQNEPVDYTFRKSYSKSSDFSPIPDNAEVLISEGAFKQTSGSGASIVQVSDKVELGHIEIDRDRNETGWVTVEFLNTYNSPPAVVATGLSFNGSHPALSRVRNITTNNFQIRIEEWPYLDGNHTTETVTFLVAAVGDNIISIRDSIDGAATDYKISAGLDYLDISNSLLGTGNNARLSMKLVNTSLPPTVTTVFANLASANDDTPATVRIEPDSTLTNFRFRAGMQKQDLSAGNVATYRHGGETMAWIAMPTLVGFLDYGISANAPIQIGKSSNKNHQWKDVTFEVGHFTKAPIIGVSMQTANDLDTAVIRFGDDEPTKNGFDVRIEEEASQQSEIGHDNETIGFIAVEHNSEYKIRVGMLSEPTGILQQNSGSIRFGLAVYNYDHSRNPTSIYTDNTVHGGTFRPCYPDTSKPVSQRSNFDICLDTHVKSPISNIINVIEDHPLIWGTTPIAETLYDIKGYFAQENFARNGHTQWYDNGTEGTGNQRNSYEISNEWDPYYYEDFGTRLPCAKSFVLHFNDGAPYRDFDGSGHPTVSNDGVGNFGSEQMLDDLALELRKNDCRTDNGMTGHQDIISYYVYAALGEDEAFNDDSRRMREAAANGGFVDDNGNNQPDPAHPSNFNDYITNNSGNCTPNEWDENGDCNPDTFYFANDAEELVNQLNAALESITARAGSGGSASVIAASRSGEGAIYNAIFRPSVISAGKEVTWVGDVHALMIDDAGYLRQDDGDKILESESADPYVDMCSYNDGETKEVRVKLSNTLASRPTSAQTQACSASVFNIDLFDLEYLWSGSNWLSALSNAQVTAQRSYESISGGRYIFSGVDVNADGIVDGSETIDFMPNSFETTYYPLINADLEVSKDIINFIRGEDHEDFRSREYNGKTLRLGDVIYSTPTVAGRPAENFDLIYGSVSYQNFFNYYRYRRQVVYAGGNDGLLHAFNGGWYNPETKKFQKAKGSGAAGSSIEFDLGAELWAYSPYNTLAHLEYLTRKNYGAAPSDHIYFVDLKPRLFDAKIFDSTNADHPGGWGTLLVVGSRLGGGAITAGPLPDGSIRNLSSSYSIFDVTNPDKPPRLLIEFTHPDLGFTTALPTPVFYGNSSDGDGEWYLLIGSGPDNNASGFDEVKSTQQAKLFLIDLKKIVSGAGVTGYNNVLAAAFGNNGILTLPDNNSFISDLTTVDHSLDNFTTDAIYFGTVSGDKSSWGGKVYRMVIQNNNGAQVNPSAWNPTVVYDPNRPVTAPVSTATDNRKNRWLHVGTGRFFTQDDNLDTSSNVFLGLKEPRNTNGIFTYGTIPTGTLANITNTNVVNATGGLTNPPVDLGDNPTVTTLEQAMKNYTSATDYIPGWIRELNNGERNFGAATIFGGTLTYTSFQPEFNDCSVQGDSRLYVLNTLTGTAGRNAILADDENDPYNTYVVDLGDSPATSPSIHIGDGYESDNKANAIIQTSDGSITTVEQTNKNKVRSGEVSWRQLK